MEPPGPIAGSVFLRDLYLSQYHARIWELQEDGWPIEASEAVGRLGFKSYRLARGGQASMGI
jgi:hypothetical protein